MAFNNSVKRLFRPEFFRASAKVTDYTKQAQLETPAQLTVKAIHQRPLAYLRSKSRESLDAWIAADAKAWEITKAGINRPPYRGPRGKKSGASAGQKKWNGDGVAVIT